jgi:DNA-binding NarL/FixJ family response regulator
MRVQLVDAHGVMRAGLQALLQEQDGLQVVGAAGDGAEVSSDN